MMTSRERLTAVLKGDIPDCVPVSPDTSNMIPAKLTGKPFWDLYLYQDPPIWKAYIDCVKYFGFDSLMDGYVPIEFDDLSLNDDQERWETAIISGTEDRIITRKYMKAGKKKVWDKTVDVYYRDNPPTLRIDPLSLKLPETPERFEPLEGVKSWPKGEELLKLAKDEMGDHGLVGVWCGQATLLGSDKAVYDYFDNPSKYHEIRDRLLTFYEKRFKKLMSLEHRPDFICTGSSGTLIFQTPEIFKELAFPIVKKMTSLGKEYNIPTHVHSCGPEKELVRICAEETDLTVIDPLEIPPMGDCDLKELKNLYGKKIVLKGNLHTTTVMLHGSAEDVKEAAKKAIDDAGEGGGFILSTGDQCGRDTPHENIFAMIETARTYGKY